MKKLFLLPYSLVRWLIILVIFLSLFLVLLIEAPAIPLSLAKNQLKELGISYSSIKGGLLSGIHLKDVNYQNQIKVKKLDLKVDWAKLEERVLYIDDIKIEGIEIEREYLATLIDSNSSEDNETESNTTLPFDIVVLNQADISLKNIIYDAYKVNYAELKIRDFTTDMKEQHKGDIKLILDSNVTQIKLDGSIKNDFVKLIAKIEANRKFVNPLLADNNIILKNNPILTVKADGNMEKVKYHLNIHQLSLKQNEYEVDSKKLILFGRYNIPKKDVKVTVKTELKGSMAYLKLDGGAKLNLDNLNNTLDYNIDTTINPNHSFLSQTLSEQNVTVVQSPTIKLKSSGSMKKLKYHLTVEDINLKQNAYSLQSDTLLLHGDYSLLDKDVLANIKTTIESNVAKLKIDGDTKLNLDDINNTLNFNILANITPKKEFVESKIPDNISIEHVADIDIVANGTLRDTKFKVDFQSLKAKREDIDIEIKSLLLSGKTDPLGGDTEVDISTDFDSNAGSGNIEDKITLNFNRVEESLNYKGKIAIDAKPKYLNKLLVKEKIVLKGTPKIRIEIDGGVDKIKLKLDANSDFARDGKRSKITVRSSPITLDLKNPMVEGSLKVENSSKEIGFNLDSKFSGDYTRPKKLNIDTTLDIKSFNMFGVNLDHIKPVKLKVKNSSSGAFITLNSKRLNLHAKTSNHDHFTFDIKSDKVYLYRIIELPKELDSKFVQLNLKGSAIVSKEHFSLKGTVDSNKKFQAKIDIVNNDSGIDGSIKTEYLLAKIKGNIKKKNIDSSIYITSLRQLQVELNKLYKFKKFNIDGVLRANAKVRGEEIWTKINSPILVLNGFNIEKIGVDAHYNKKLLTISKLSLETKGFDDKELNKKMYLNQPAKIYLGKKRSILLDMHPNILVKGKGTEDNMDAKVKIDRLPVGHPDYGSMFLNCDINYEQRGLDKKITGLIDIRKMNLFYEAKFLDADYDPDVVIVSKDNKNKKDKEEDLFLKHTAIDIAIKAPEARYRTPDIDLVFDINLKAKKLLGNSLAMLGKVEDINGRVDQVPKRFLIKNSNIVFAGGEKINPLLDINVEHELPQVLIHITVGGNAKRPKIEFTSDPPMPKKDIMSYLLLGVSATQIGEGGGSLGREAQLFILNQAARDLAYEFELDRVFVKDDGTGEGFAIETGKNISKKNMIIIESSKQGNSFILEHDVSKNIKLRVGQHQKEIPSQSIDIYFRKRFK